MIRKSYILAALLAMGVAPAFCFEPPPSLTAEMQSNIVAFGRLATDAVGVDYETIKLDLIRAAPLMGVKCSDSARGMACVGSSNEGATFSMVSLLAADVEESQPKRKIFSLRATLSRGVFISKEKLISVAFGDWGRPLPRKAVREENCVETFVPNNSGVRDLAILEVRPDVDGCYYPVSLTISYYK